MHVAITGASSGIGEAMAREWARAGAKLTLVARRREMLEALANEIGGAPHVRIQDLSDSDRATDWIAEAEATHGPIDVLVNNAGTENTGATATSDVDGAVRLLHLNLITPLKITRSLLPAMLARKSGVIVDVASVVALAPTPMQSWYGASKAGLAAFSESLRGELRGTGVHVVTVYPGPVKTAMADHAYEVFGGRKGVVGLMPEGNTATLARRVRIAVERRKARIIYPRFYVTTRLFPWLARWMADMGPRTPALEARRHDLVS